MFAGSSLSRYNGTVRLSGGRQCEGEVEVYVSQRWRGVLLGSWTLSEASVVCRQLACGSAVGFSDSAGSESDGCVSGFRCSGQEAHLGNCSAPQIQNCSSGQHVTMVCSGPPSPTTRPPSPTTRPPVTSVGAFCPPVSPVAVATLGLLFLLLLGPLLVLLRHNRSLRRALSKRRHMALSEGVYEEIDYRRTQAGSSTRRQRGRVLSDAHNSWYEDVEEDERRPASGAELREPTLEYYDDVADDNETNLDDILTDIGDLLFGSEMRSGVEEYDDVGDVTSVEKSSGVTDYALENPDYDDVGDGDEGPISSEPLGEEAPEYYDDITTDDNGPKMSNVMKETELASEKEYYDDIGNEANDLQTTTGTVTADELQEYDDVITAE
ncbi:hypothetical protein ACEWY4_001933 [Coilia grayii]|uniref:SRCR domain-containing protein n=1 Tax=Coilia grayii TaxID=363190 RepID=A0ABD1KUF1_9TELE